MLDWTADIKGPHNREEIISITIVFRSSECEYDGRTCVTPRSACGSTLPTDEEFTKTTMLLFKCGRWVKHIAI